MNMATKTDIFKRYLGEYLKANKQRKGEIIKHINDVAGLHPQSIIRWFRVQQKRHPLDYETRGRPVYYTPDVTAALKEIWTMSGELCGDNLAGLLAPYVTALTRACQWTYQKTRRTGLRELQPPHTNDTTIYLLVLVLSSKVF
jgi:hypothetical protein